MILRKFIVVALYISLVSSAYAYRVPIGKENNTKSTQQEYSNTTITANPQIESSNNTVSNNTVSNNTDNLPYHYPKKDGHYVFTPQELWDNNPNNPPGPVLDFLTRPDTGTGKLYLDWLNQRNNALKKSFLVLEELKNAEFVKHLEIIKPRTQSELIIVYVSPNQASANQLLSLQQIKAIFPDLQVMVYPLGDNNAILRMLYQYGFQSDISENTVTENLAKIVSAVPSVYLFNKQSGNIMKIFAGGANAKEILKAL